MTATAAQTELSLFARDQGARAWDVVRAAVQAAVDVMTLKETAFLLDTSPSQLADALAERDRKSVKAEWLVILLVAAPLKVREPIVAEINRLCGFKRPTLAEKLTPEQELAIVRRAMKRLAPGLVNAIDEEIAADGGRW